MLQGDPGQEYFIAVPRLGARDAPLCLLVHGISRNSRELIRVLWPYAEALGVVLVAPHFALPRHDRYQRLGRDRNGSRSDLVLDEILEEAASLTGASSAQVYMFGHSGGAQFVHRYAMAYPARVARAVVTAAGWYTFPDPRRRFPYGIKPSKHLRGLAFDPEAFLRVPMTVLVGSEDTSPAGVRRGKRVDEQGTTRVERARNWVAAMHAAATAYHLEPAVTLQVLDGGGHSFKDLVTRSELDGRVFAALFGLPAAENSGGGNAER